jgi:glycosyltransferase involved in cell wall biosynthesis
MVTKGITENPLVTVVTVTYNSAAYVRDAIESVLAQQYTNFELIIGDDCSTDETWQIIQEYHDPRIKAYHNTINLKEYPNRNKAIEMATGKYLIFIDGDDVIYPHGLAFMVRMMECFPQSAMAIMRGYHPKLIYPVELTPHDLFIAEYFNKSLLDSAFTNTLFKTSALRDAGGLSSAYISGDTYVRLKIAKVHRCLLISDSLTWWRMTPGQATSKLTGIQGMVQHYTYRSEMLDSDAPLTSDERALALQNMQYKIIRVALSMMLKARFKKSLLLLRATGLLFKAPVCLTYGYKAKDPFAQYSAVKPFRLEFSRNPYSNSKPIQ